MISMAREEVIQYFSDKAENYDDVDEQFYWNLSDELLWYMLEKKVLPELDDSFRILDAGGGTGRWITKILRNKENAKGVLFDLSEEMLNQAREKVDTSIENRIEIVQGDLNNIDSKLEKKFDLIISFHNVLGFVQNPENVVNDLEKLTHEDSILVSFVPNKYHGVYFNQKIGKLNEAERICSIEKGKFTEDMPDINFFTPSKIESIYKNAGLETVETYGLPVSIYPGFKETQIEGNTKSLQETLSDKENFNRIREIEKSLILDEEVASRGNNILAIGKKNKSLKD